MLFTLIGTRGLNTHIHVNSPWVLLSTQLMLSNILHKCLYLPRSLILLVQEAANGERVSVRMLQSIQYNSD